VIRDFEGNGVAIGVSQGLRFSNPLVEEAKVCIFAFRKACEGRWTQKHCSGRQQFISNQQALGVEVILVVA